MIDLWPHVVRQAVIDMKRGKPADKRSAKAFLRRTGILTQAEKISPRRLRNAYYARSGQWQRKPGFEVVDESVFADKVDRRRAPDPFA